jgi:hypothetical protein
MGDRDTGGPAFPFWNPGTSQDGQQTGMTLRDYFAGKALAGMLASTPDEDDPEKFACDAYLSADAMLKERSK